MEKTEKEQKSEIKKSLRLQILEANDLPTEKVFVPEWTDQPLYIRSMSGKERDDFEQTLLSMNDAGDRVQSIKNFRGQILARTLCEDKEGRIRIFTDADADALGEKSSAALDKCLEAAKRLSGISEKDQENILKN